ncbi:LacI family transcriptional regulator [Actinoalloteichus hymeniacidonis]|uniref:Transcriptional regulator, LacI family n=2 Tax=Actinoalloteichus hymeniacidonis TaxID=340345 RepID=A0AAC9N192_9PSEU|nr:transcriptional regulator, LacI family [Actinoalloteichus hymeniacidonis]MBB5905732.1 LacI family transcriptional regulator [Actinoalloteichus hymeniacidonis]
MATMKDVAQAAGVSTATVSRVLNGHPAPTEQTRRRVAEAIEALGYRPNTLARSLRLHTTHTLGLVISDLTNPFFAEVARAVENEAREHGYSVVVGNANESVEQQRRYVRTLLDRRVDGLLVCPATDEGDWLAEAAETGVPLVLLDRRIAGSVKVPVVRVDGTAALDNLAAHLVALGHRRIGVIAGPAEASTGRERLDAFAAALGSRGAPLAERLVVYGDFQRPSGASAAHTLMSGPNRPTALVAMDNLMGLGALEQLRAMGFSVPGDVGLAVYDDLPWFSLLEPAITAIAQPTDDLGHAAVRVLLDLIERGNAENVVLDAELVIRSSCGERAEHGRGEGV